MNNHIPIKKYLVTAKICALQLFDGNFLFVFAGYAIRLIRLIVMIAVFRSLPPGSDMSGTQMLTYALLSSAFSEQLYIFTPATTALWEGSIINRFTRPVPVIGQFIAETCGKWVPSLLFYTLPVCVLAPLFGINLVPQQPGRIPLFLISLILGISLGFCIDILFSAFAMRLKNGCFAALMIREALTAILSGALIPFALLPGAVGKVLSLLPFGSLAGAPLSVYVGTGNSFELIALSLFWNAVLWPACILFYQKSKESMISYGG